MQLEAGARQIALLNEAQEWGDRFENDAWKKNLSAKILKKYTRHPLAKHFRALEKDAELFGICFEEKKSLEKAVRTKEALLVQLKQRG